MHIPPWPPPLAELKELLKFLRGAHEGFSEPWETRIAPEERGPHLLIQVQDHPRERAIVEGPTPRLITPEVLQLKHL